MRFVYFRVQLYLLDVSLTWLLSGAILSSLMIYGQGPLPVSICKQPSLGQGVFVQSPGGPRTVGFPSLPCRGAWRSWMQRPHP